MEIEKKFNYKGYDCIIGFTTLGYRVGTIIIPKGHKLYGLYPKDISIELKEIISKSPMELNFSGFYYRNNDSNKFYIEFDCSGENDLRDLKCLEKYFPGIDINGCIKRINESIISRNKSSHMHTIEDIESYLKEIIDLF